MLSWVAQMVDVDLCGEDDWGIVLEVSVDGGRGTEYPLDRRAGEARFAEGLFFTWVCLLHWFTQKQIAWGEPRCSSSPGYAVLWFAFTGQFGINTERQS